MEKRAPSRSVAKPASRASWFRQMAGPNHACLLDSVAVPGHAQVAAGSSAEIYVLSREIYVAPGAVNRFGRTVVLYVIWRKS